MSEDNSDKPILTFTKDALVAVEEKINESEGDNNVLRVSVIGGGCSGYQYGMDIQEESDQRMGDHLLEFPNFKVLVDPISADYLRGTTIEYVVTLQASGFTFNNPGAKRTCGCGKSFS